MLTAAERRLRRAYRNGTLLDLRGTAGNVIRAEVLSGLLLDAPGAAGGRIARVDLAGAHITGGLDLTGARLETPLRLRHCVFEEKVLLDHAELVSLNLDGSVLPGVQAEAVRLATGLRAHDARIAGDVWLPQAQVSGTVTLDRSAVGGMLHLQRAVIGGGVHLREGVRVDGGIKLSGARIGGDLSLSDARLGTTGDDGAALAAPGLTVGGALLAHRLHTGGGINLIGAQLGGGAAFNNCVLRRPDGYALLLIEAQARLLTLRPAAGSAGTISLRDAHFGRVVDDPVTWPEHCRIELGAVQNIGIGFGYRPVRALLWLLAVIAAGTAWFAISGPLRAVKPEEATDVIASGAGPGQR